MAKTGDWRDTRWYDFCFMWRRIAYDVMIVQLRDAYGVPRFTPEAWSYKVLRGITGAR